MLHSSPPHCAKSSLWNFRPAELRARRVKPFDSLGLHVAAAKNSLAAQAAEMYVDGHFLHLCAKHTAPTRLRRQLARVLVNSVADEFNLDRVDDWISGAQKLRALAQGHRESFLVCLRASMTPHAVATHICETYLSDLRKTWRSASSERTRCEGVRRRLSKYESDYRVRISPASVLRQQGSEEQLVDEPRSAMVADMLETLALHGVLPDARIAHDMRRVFQMG